MFASIETAANPDDPDVIPGVRLFAVIGTWMEADIVESTVHNARIQGCERVYLVDNASTDDTVERALAAGATLARTYATARYDESVRLDHMNGVVAEISERESDSHLWWLFLDADEFPHGPSGMTLGDHVRTLDRRFRVVGMRCFDHYPVDLPHHLPGRHPIDAQPWCHELALSMCSNHHRKHSLLRVDKKEPPIRAGNGFHLVECERPLCEPAQPAFLHHFPYRDESVTRARLNRLWIKDSAGATRADPDRDTHMQARLQSLAAVYSQAWDQVVNFVALDSFGKQMASQPRPAGVELEPWADTVPAVDQHMLRWYPLIDAWRYDQLPRFQFGDDTSYRRGLAFLDGHGTIEDWGCGFTRARHFVTQSRYVGLDGSSPDADQMVDLTTYRSTTDCIFMRHVLEHNGHWRTILHNAVASFTRRMVLIVFTPFADATHVIATSNGMTSIPVPDISFKKTDLTALFAGVRYHEESLSTDTQYGTEHVFYLEKA